MKIHPTTLHDVLIAIKKMSHCCGIFRGRTFDCVNWDQPAKAIHAWRLHDSKPASLMCPRCMCSRILYLGSSSCLKWNLHGVTFQVNASQKPLRFVLVDMKVGETHETSQSVWQEVYEIHLPFVRKGGATRAFTALQHQQKVSRSFHQGCKLLSSVWSEVFFLSVPASQ